ncbi:hypothetical protein PMIN03_004844 [Paraphaeosphaeria minitans]
MTLHTQSAFIENEMRDCGASEEFQCTICLDKHEDGVVQIDHHGRSCYFHRDCLISWFSSLDAPSGAFQIAQDIVMVMQEGDTPRQLVFDYRHQASVILRAVAQEFLSRPETGPEVEALQHLLIVWAVSFYHSAPAEIDHDLKVVLERIRFLKSRSKCGALLREEQQQLNHTTQEFRAIRDAFLAGVRAGPRASPIETAEEFLALLNRSQALIMQIGELRGDHNGPFIAPPGRRLAPSAPRLRLPDPELDEHDLGQVGLALAGLEM